MAKLKLREGLTRDLFTQWLMPKRAFLLAAAGEIGANPDQRIHADAQHLAELSIDLSVGLLQATVLLVSFIGVLWTLSAGVVFEIEGRSFVIPGYMVWCSLAYAGAASLASWRVGRPLLHLGAERYARESDLRFALVHVNEQREAIAVYRGEAEEEGRLREEFDRLLVVLRRLIGATTRLTWVTAGYGWFTIVAPIIVAAPAYFGGNLSFGGLLMAVGAITQVQQSLRWFVDNAGAIADWRATLARVGDFRQALPEIDKIGDEASHIELVATAEDKLVFDDLGVTSPSGCTSLNEAHVEMAPGEHVLIVGAPGSGKTSLFRAIAGLWPWGSGRIGLPAAEQFMFMPKRPYISDGALRDVLAYPASPDGFTEQKLISVLTRMGLLHLTRQLDRVARWDKELIDFEQQGLAFARMLLHNPRWVIVDEAIGSLAPEARKTLFHILEKELATTTLVCISGPQAQDKFYTRVLHLTMNQQGQRLAVPCLPCATAPKEEEVVSANSRQNISRRSKQLRRRKCYRTRISSAIRPPRLNSSLA
ncbi:ABC transporter ATP-binding protein/permease [Methylocystis hirsuta]|uniref:ABC transporter ATP-binding protein/permease n=1 Tax=Methylocystis hirsuta TaxID=369798 RepID=UPI001FDF08B4|nr:ABC transporter ATP-binding protein/permease [Methylocystis hirsuta]